MTLLCVTGNILADVLADVYSISLDLNQKCRHI